MHNSNHIRIWIGVLSLDLWCLDDGFERALWGTIVEEEEDSDEDESSDEEEEEEEEEEDIEGTMTTDTSSGIGTATPHSLQLRKQVRPVLFTALSFSLPLFRQFPSRSLLLLICLFHNVYVPTLTDQCFPHFRMVLVRRRLLPQSLRNLSIPYWKKRKPLCHRISCLGQHVLMCYQALERAERAEQEELLDRLLATLSSLSFLLSFFYSTKSSLVFLSALDCLLLSFWHPWTGGGLAESWWARGSWCRYLEEKVWEPNGCSERYNRWSTHGEWKSLDSPRHHASIVGKDKKLVRVGRDTKQSHGRAFYLFVQHTSESWFMLIPYVTAD